MRKQLFLLLMTLLPTITMAYDAEIDGIYYNFNGTEATVTFGDNKYTGDIVIPETVTYNETVYSVVSIGSNAFGSCRELTSVTIPNSVTTIGDLAFVDSSDLTSITIPTSVTSIGERAFQDCSALMSIIVDEGSESYASEDGVLFNKAKTILVRYPQAKNETAYIIPNNVKTIGNSAFDDCTSLTSVMIPNSVTSIELWAFKDCNGLTSVTIPSSVTTIGEQAFISCSGLTSVTISNGVTSIGNSAFASCSGLTSIVIPNSVTSISDGAFFSCRGLTAITVDDDNASYASEDGVLFNKAKTVIVRYPPAKSGKAYVISNNVTSIAACAFESCCSLTSVTIPNSVTSIEYQAFSGCSGLISITIPNRITNIGWDVFGDCSGLITVTIPNSVKSIESVAFIRCEGLKDIYCYAEIVPTTESYSFFSTPIENITLHVPAASIGAYKTTVPWSDFKEIVESDKLDVVDLNINARKSNMQEISLNNGHTDFVAFQMDLILPEGVGIDKTGCTLSSRITDEEQELKIGKLESGAYRITSTSLSLKPISGNDGALLNLKLTAEDGCIGGEAILSNIIFSTAESEKVVMSDKTFDISILYNLTYKVDGEEYKTSNVAYGTTIIPEAEPTKKGYTFGGWSEIPETMPNHNVEITGRFYLYGDVNTDEAVDVVDVVDIARFVVATPSANFREKLADLNFDNTVNIADAVTLVNFIAGDQNFSRMMTPSNQYDYDQCQLQLLSNGSNALSLCLDGTADFTAFQFEVELPENTDITAMSINGQRMDNHQLLYNKVGEDRYRVAALSLSNAVFKGNTGELLNISIDGVNTNGISVQDIHFVTKNGTDITFDDQSLSGTVTGITNVRNNEGNDVIFDLQGRKLSKVQRGVHIINGKKVVMK